MEKFKWIIRKINIENIKKGKENIWHRIFFKFAGPNWVGSYPQN